jgi:hypothetical protein
MVWGAKRGVCVDSPLKKRRRQFAINFILLEQEQDFSPRIIPLGQKTWNQTLRNGVGIRLL